MLDNGWFCGLSLGGSNADGASLKSFAFHFSTRDVPFLYEGRAVLSFTSNASWVTGIADPR